ncbi:MAG: DUF1353 domain-containing protein [Pseudomonadota bacterium]|nr:DUF1353 domain-containing protein [Pseudomonadota bacterium]
MVNGSFSGNPKTEWMCDDGEDRNMRLLEPFWYTDPQGRRWDAPAGSVTNGASIPRTLWSSVGSPFTGNYRRASIIHDIAIRNRAIVRGDADTMFYFACLAGGCMLVEGKLLYAGVRVGSWASLGSDYAGSLLSLLPAAPRLPGQQSPAELAMRAKYTLLASELNVTADDFPTIRATVERHLGPAAPP